MITKYTKKTLKKAIEEEDFQYPYTSLIADKLRAIYTLFGWVHMLDEFDTAHKTIEELTMHLYKELAGEAKDCEVMTVGLKICGWFDEDEFLNLDYYFSLE